MTSTTLAAIGHAYRLPRGIRVMRRMRWYRCRQHSLGSPASRRTRGWLNPAPTFLPVIAGSSIPVNSRTQFQQSREQ
jgi:hypothetical protein